MLGGYACAAHLGFGIAEIDPTLTAITAEPEEFGHLPMIASLQDAWHRVIEASPHLKLLARAAVVGHDYFVRKEGADMDEPMPDMEAKYDELWRKDMITGGTPLGTAYGSYVFDDDLEEAIANALLPGNNLTAKQVRMAEKPQDHMSIITLWSQTPWIMENWPIQKLIDRSMSRLRFEAFWRSLPTLEEELRIRAQLNPLASIPLRALPSVPLNKLNDSQFLWVFLDRLGIQHPEAEGLDTCTCAAAKPVKKGRHFRRCAKGGGITFVHDCTRDVIASMHRHAGVVVQVEPQGILPGTDERPADVLAIGTGAQHRDVAIDIAVVDSQELATDAEARMCAMTSGLKARKYTAWKRTRTTHAGAPTMEERLRNNGYDCVPLVFEVDGATDGTFATYIKKLSEIANQRRGHDQAYFQSRWKTAIAMTLAKRGAQAAIRRARTVQCRTVPATGVDDDEYGDGPLGTFGVEAPNVLGFTDTASPVYSDGSFY
jgi:hypothetical protein